MRLLELNYDKNVETNHCRPPTSCADTAVQCYIEAELSPEEPDRERERESERFLDEKIDNPLSDTSTWNTELPNIGNLSVWDSQTSS